MMSSYIKAGLAGADSPRAYFPSIVVYPKHRKHSEFTIGRNEKKFEYDEINNWYDMEKIIKIKANEISNYID